MKDASSKNNLISSDEDNENIDGNQVRACGQLIFNCKHAVCQGRFIYYYTSSVGRVMSRSNSRVSS